MLAEGTRRIAQKVGEEGLELALAAVAEADDEVVGGVGRSAFHAMVLLRSRNLTLESVVAELAARHLKRS